MEKEISQAVIRRMPRYYRYLGELLEEGVERISSNDLSHRMMVTASQIRQDLNNFGGFGQQGYGYNVKYLYDEIGKILGLNETHNIIMIGAGNLGQRRDHVAVTVEAGELDDGGLHGCGSNLAWASASSRSSRRFSIRSRRWSICAKEPRRLLMSPCIL